MNLMSSIAKTLVGSVIAIVSVAPERLNLILLSGVGGNELDDGRVELELWQVDGRDAVLLAQEGRDLHVLDKAHLDEVVAELPPVGLLVIEGLLELLRSYPLLFEKE